MVAARERRGNREVNLPGQRWQITYCSFALILVVFFVMVLSNSIVSRQSVALVQQQFSFSDTPLVPDFSLQSSSREQENMPTAVLHDAARNLNLDHAVDLKITSTGIDIVLPGYLLFSGNKKDVDAQIFPYLNVIGDVVAKNGFSLQIKVYDALSEDKNDTSMARQTSWGQAAYRAVNLMRYFLAHGRLSPDQVAAAGFIAQEAPSPENHIANQGRVELHLAVKGSQ